VSDSTFAATDEFVCKVYDPQTHITEIDKLRWWLFRKKQAESEKLLPTPAALHCKQFYAAFSKPWCGTMTQLYAL